MPALRGPHHPPTFCPVRGEHTTILEEPGEPRASPTLPQQPCFIADYDKGGDTVTAIGLETHPLGTLSGRVGIPRFPSKAPNSGLSCKKNTEECYVYRRKGLRMIVRWCIQFAKASSEEREASLLSGPIKACKKHLGDNKSAKVSF